MVAVLRRDWLQLVLIAWAAIAAWQLISHWPQLRWLVLSDTDDNMRLSQVRALLGGQDWFDLRQYKLNPPRGFDMHWTRIVDLPIAALILLLKPFVGLPWAERLACGIAPLLPMAVAMGGLAYAVRRLVSPLAWPLSTLFLLLCGATMLMFAPMRIDHHGWQLASLALTVAGLADGERRRGGALVGLASAFSLSIGLEMLPYAAGAGAIIALRWVWDRAEAPRMIVYGACLSGGSALGYALFASYANAVPRCDALTPVWLSVMIESGALLVALGWINPARREGRLALAAAAGAALAAAFVLSAPQCLGRPEQVSPELARNWLNNVREAKPIYTHPFRTAFPVIVLPVIGLIGAAIATWRARGADRAVWGAVLLFTAFSVAMLLWQMRAGPAAQLLAVPGAVALAWWILPQTLRSRYMLVRVLGTPAAFVLVSGAFAGLVVQYLPVDKPATTARNRMVNRAGASCSTITSLGALDRLPPQTIFTFVDLGPRLITLTHHRAIAGPYHRNGDAILDVQHGFGRGPDAFRQIARAHGAQLLLICPNMAESTIYEVRNPGGFYDRLNKGERFDFLEPVALPDGSPLRLWRIKP
ncbi:MAG: AcrB/AcrD/AcrF family protein [Sphingomonas sp.]|nr:AcrB/AcrD/AcrF family protein [Sphingomonas sp.]